MLAFWSMSEESIIRFHRASVMIHARRRAVRLLFVLAAAGWLAVTLVSGAAAASSTPEAKPDIPPPADCTVQPRSEASLLNLQGTPVAGQVPEEGQNYVRVPSVPDGSAVDAATQRAILATIRTWTACVNAGDQLRALALFSDDYFRRIVLTQGAFTDSFVKSLEKIHKEEKKNWLPVPTMKDWRKLPDGRVGAVVLSVRNKTDVTPFYVFAKHGDRWLIDEILEITGKVP